MQLQDQAISLRKKGKSYSEIHSLLGVPKSTLSYWFRGIVLSPKLQQRLREKSRAAGAEVLIKRNKMQTVVAQERAMKVRLEAKKEILSLNTKDLFLTGIALYWAEGYKRGAYTSRWRCVDFTNSDPSMLEVIMRFFRECCKVPESKFKIQLMLHDKTTEKAARKFWSQLLCIPLSQFTSASFALSTASKKKHVVRLPYGTVHIRIHDIDLFYRIIGWIEGMQLRLVIHE